MWQAFIDWFWSLGPQYGVNPIIFGSIYVGAIPFFTLSLGWFVRNMRQKKTIALPALSTGFFFISAYLYLLIAGQNIPVWVYIAIVILVAFGIYTTVQKVKSQLANADGRAPSDK